MVSDSILVGLQESEYAVYVGPDDRVQVRLRAWPRPPSYYPDLRLHRVGMMELPVPVTSGATRFGIPVDRQRELIAIARQLTELPELSVCGSNSPISCRPPYASSDLDLVCFVPIAQAAAEPDRWATWLATVKREVAPVLSRHLRQEVSIGLLATEQRCLPGMADVVAAEDLRDYPDRADRAAVLGQRISDFLDCTELVRHDLLTLVRALRRPATPIDLSEPVLYVGPRWVDITEFFVNGSRRNDAIRSGT